MTEQEREARNEERQEIRRTVDPRQWLTPARQNTYVCPFCGSGTGKHHTGMKYFQQSNLVYCWNCKMSYDAIDIYTKVQGVDFSRAVTDLGSGTSNKQIKKISSLIGKSEPKPAKDYSNYYAECRKHLEDPRAVAYLQGRGISLETAKAYGVGFDPKADTAETGRYFCPRMIVPSSRGHYVAKRTDGGEAYKSMNPKGAEAGITNLQELGRAGLVFVVEGAFDGMSITEAGGGLAVVLNSTSNAKKFMAYVKEHRPQALLLLAMDNDKGGRDTQEELKKELAKERIPYRVAGGLCKAGQDLNDSLVENRQEFIKAVQVAMEPIREKPMETVDTYSSLMQAIKAGKYKARETGISEFDKLMGGGLIPGQVILIGGQAGSNKTAACQWIAEQMAQHYVDFRALFFCLEMSANQLLARSLSRVMDENNLGDLSCFDILQGTDMPAIERGIQVHSSLIGERVRYNLGVDNALSFPPAIGEIEKAVKGAEKVDLFVVDYIQLVDAGGHDEAENIKRVMPILGNLAREKNAICLCTMASNRTSNARAEKGESGGLGSGRGSSSLEYGADSLITIAREESGVKNRVMTLEKARVAEAGKNCRLLFNFDGRHMRLKDLDYSNARVANDKENKEINSLLDMDSINRLKK